MGFRVYVKLNDGLMQPVPLPSMCALLGSCFLQSELWAVSFRINIVVELEEIPAARKEHKKVDRNSETNQQLGTVNEATYHLFVSATLFGGRARACGSTPRFATLDTGAVVSHFPRRALKSAILL
jgi:hypothetical protein